MTTVPVPTYAQPREEWPDADFDIPEGGVLHDLDAESDKEDDAAEDWDVEMDFGMTGGAKATAVVAGIAARSGSVRGGSLGMTTIRPPLVVEEEDDNDEIDDDEGVSTIKVAQLPRFPPPPAPSAPMDEDIESAFALPSDLTKLSLAPLSLNHRSSKNSLEWGDKDHTYSSQSSDAYSTFGFTDASPSSNSTSSASQPASETEDEPDEDDGELDGLVIPTGLFEADRGAKHLTKILEMKKKVQFPVDQVKVVSPDPEDNFEIGLVIEDDIDLSPSRLLISAKEQSRKLTSNRSKSVPTRPPPSLRPASRSKIDRAKSPSNPPPSSVRQLQKISISASPPPLPGQPSRPRSSQAMASAPISGSFLTPKPGSVRGQKSYSALKPPTPPSTQRKLLRKASLSSLIEASNAQASGSGTVAPSKLARYEATTVASRAKSQTNSVSRLEHGVPPTRPSTPSSNPVALRLTMPTMTRLKSRPSIASVFPSPTAMFATGSRTTSPVQTRPPSSLSIKSRTSSGRTLSPPQPSAPKVLRKPKRIRTYGDGTELDAFEDLVTDRDRESRYRVQPKGYGNRVPGGSYPAKQVDSKHAARKKTKRDTSPDSSEKLGPGSRVSKKSGTSDGSSPKSTLETSSSRKKKTVTSPGQTHRKPTLIRNLGGSNAPKVVGEMRWNPHTLRWEGNDQILRDFEVATGTSSRPALITHLTGSSVGSPAGGFPNGTRVVGNMKFDPMRMCWLSTLPPEEDEPDVFADLADDEDDGDSWEAKADTIRASQQVQPMLPGSCNTSASSSNTSTSSTQVGSCSPARSHSRTRSESGSDRGSRASIVYDIDDDFLDNCRLAETRHWSEMKVWCEWLRTDDIFDEPDRTWLYDIRALATRQYSS